MPAQRQRRIYRWYPTLYGLQCLTNPETHGQVTSRSAEDFEPWLPVHHLLNPATVLQAGRASRSWLRFLVRRLDIFSTIYYFAGYVSVLMDNIPVGIKLYRDLDIDGGIELPDGRCYAIIVKTPGFGGRFFADRMVWARRHVARVSGTFVITHSYADLFETIRECRPLDGFATAVGVSTVISDVDSPSWRFMRLTTRFFSLRELLVAIRGPHELPDDRSETKQFQAPKAILDAPEYLSRRQTDLLHAIANWPLSTASTLAAITGSALPTVEMDLTNLRRLLLVRFARKEGHVRNYLSDKAIYRIADASRTHYPRCRQQWSSTMREDGSHRGTALRSLSREIKHNDMVHRMLLLTFRQAADAPGARVITAYPPHRSMRYFNLGGYANYSIRPDATLYVTTNDKLHILLLEAERRAVHAKRMRERLLPYLRYDKARVVHRDYVVPPKVVLVVPDAGVESRFLMSQESQGLAQLPIYVTNRDQIERLGPFREVWKHISDPFETPRRTFWRE